jgi:hypothetical protein
LAAAVLTVAYFGLALQYFQLRHRGRGPTYFGLFLFIFWLLPLLAGSIQSMAYRGSHSGDAASIIFALSPVAGIGLIYGLGDSAMAYSAQAAAITPILLFTFLFNYLLVGARRRVMTSVFTATAGRPDDKAVSDVVDPVSGALGD